MIAKFQLEGSFGEQIKTFKKFLNFYKNHEKIKIKLYHTYMSVINILT